MKKYYFSIIVFIFLISLSCSRYEDNIIDPNIPTQVGKISLSISEAPHDIVSVVAKLTRNKYEDRIAILTIADTGQSASGTFNDVPIGIWRLSVEAMNAFGKIRYRGGTSIEILPGQTSMVELHLLPTHGNIEIRVSWGESKILVPDHSKWEWTQDSRGGGSQSKLVNNNGIIEIHPVDHVHFFNRSINQGKAIYKFKFKGVNFKFAWRITPNLNGGTALILEKVPGGEYVGLIHVNWSGFYYGWHNNYSAFGNPSNVTFDSSSWHEVEIRETGNDLEIYFDRQKLNMFENQIPASQFLADVGNGYIGIGNDDYSIVSYKDFQIIPY
ncbi:MAG: hypothetical protein QME52_00100 [Bacteroidota bacterium]|nr:hypothetical protein [Bacteroidota bacterium]